MPFGKICNNCKKINHFANVCKFKKVNEINDSLTIKIDLINSRNNDAWYENLKINNTTIQFKIDTSAKVNVISQHEIKTIKFNE